MRTPPAPWAACLAVLALAALPGCAPSEEASTDADAPAATADAPDDAAAARSFAESWDPTFMRADADAMAAMFTEDAVRLAADASIQQGREAIRAAFAENFAASTPVAESDPVSDLGVAGDWAWTWGTFTSSARQNDSGEVVEETGKWLSILRRTDAGWRYQVDSWNYDAPFTGEAEPLTSHTLTTGEGRTVGPSADVEAIEAMVRNWESASVAGDVDAHMSRYAADAVRLNDRGPLDVGAPAIRATYEANQTPTSAADATIDVIEVDGDWAWARGGWGITFTGPDGGTAHDKGKWISVSQRTADGWKVKAELWNRDQPFPAPAGG